MTSIPAGGAGSIPMQNIDDLINPASPDVLKNITDSTKQIAAESEAIKQKLMGALSAAGNIDSAAFAQLAAAIEKQMQDGVGGVRHLQEPEGKLGADVAGTLAQLGGLSEQDLQTDIYAFMALFQKMAQEMRTSARETRQSEMNAQIDALKGAAQEMRNAAQDRMVGAMVAGAFQIAGGLAQVGSGIAQGATLNAGGKFAESHAKKQSDIGGGVSGIAGGIGSMANAGMERKAAEHDAKKTELEAQAKVHESGTQQASEMAQQMMDVIRDVRDKLGAIEQSRMETNRGIARNI
ncbi:type III secretion system translocon subunit SctB [Achromobacter arsenitoxydans]|uniref:Putative outer protein D n=1 Tax=Achromobacter arsenitoxydans SY8 TaxID=477184 RepID=H0F7V9_9BURK|nr:type III secretion system translocon subunit SctB [Achromobacter arsenitoxydans]EHK65678.1 putative outer protein D [Achromobacter arsenitoxydans SY8]